MDQEPIQITGKRIPVAVSLPCGSCAHQPVCRIAPVLAELDRVSVSMPALDDAVGLSLAAVATCDHYTKARALKVVDADRPAGSPPAGRKLNLSDEERQRRREQALRNVEAQRARRESEAVPA